MDQDKLDKIREIVCGSEKDRCTCKIVGEVGQTDFIPIESTKFVCEWIVYP